MRSTMLLLAVCALALCLGAAASRAGWIETGVPLSNLPANVYPSAAVPDGSGGAIIVYEVCSQGAYDIYAQRTDASGALLWGEGGAPVCTAQGEQSYATAVSDGAGGAIIVWQDGRDETNLDLYAQRINGVGEPLWTIDGVPVCNVAGDQDSPVALPDGSGGVVVCWADGRYGYPDIFIQKLNSSGSTQWNAGGVAVCTAPNYQNAQNMISDGAGGFVIEWADQRSSPQYDIYAQRIDASGSPLWTTDGVAVCALPGYQFGGSLASDAAGGAVVSWYDDRSGNQDVYAQRVDASGAVRWAAGGVTICAAPSGQYNPHPVADGTGSVIISWDDLRSGAYDVYAQRVDTSGSVLWTPDGVGVCTATGSQSTSRIVPDGAGGAIIAWNDSRVPGSDIYAQRVDGSGVALWASNGIPVCSATGDQSIAEIVGNAAAGTVVLWSDRRDNVNYEVYLQKVNGSGSAQWTVDGVRITTTGSEQVTASIASDGGGGAIVAYERNPNSGNTDVFAQRVNAFGGIEWSAEGIGVATGPGSQFYPLAVSDGADGAIIVYRQWGAGYDIYAQRIDATGAILWGAGGVAVCTALGDQGLSRVMPDGAGGAIVIWTDTAVEGNADIYAQRMSAEGLALWTPGGVAVCTAAGNQWNPEPCSDGGGGCIVSWEDYRGGSTGDIYAQRIDSAGATLWSTNGVAVCTAINNQYNPHPVIDAAGGAIIVWGDIRLIANNIDIYAQRVDAAGSALWAANGVVLCSAANQQNNWHAVADGSGGAIVCWEDWRVSSYNADIYAQRVNAAGATLWAANGVGICTDDNDSSIPQIVPDGSGGAIIVWLNTPPSSAPGDPFAQRVSSAGAAQWAANGVPVGRPVAEVRRFMTASDGAGGVVLSMELMLCNKYKIYVQRLNQAGNVVAASPPASPAILRQNYPNPFNPRTVISFYLPDARGITLDVFDVAGRLVARIAEGRREPGFHEVAWDGRTGAGIPCASGIYFCRLVAGSESMTRTMVLLR